MTKRPQFVSKLRLSKLCRWIVVLGALKLGLLISLVVMPAEDVSGWLLGNMPLGQTAHAAADATPAPPAPKIRNQQPSPFAQQPSTAPAAPVTDLQRPDAMTPQEAPAPKVSPFVPRDSAQRKQEELNRREQELLALQQQMQTRLDELKGLENKIQNMLKQANNVQDEKLKHLIDVYTNMKAKQAAEVLATLDEKIAVKILAGMRGKQAGEILTYMQPEPAAKLSELLSRTQIGE